MSERQPNNDLASNIQVTNLKTDNITSPRDTEIDKNIRQFTKKVTYLGEDMGSLSEETPRPYARSARANRNIKEKYIKISDFINYLFEHFESISVSMIQMIDPLNPKPQNLKRRVNALLYNCQQLIDYDKTVIHFLKHKQINMLIQILK